MNNEMHADNLSHNSFRFQSHPVWVGRHVLFGSICNPVLSGSTYTQQTLIWVGSTCTPLALPHPGTPKGKRSNCVVLANVLLLDKQIFRNPVTSKKDKLHAVGELSPDITFLVQNGLNYKAQNFVQAKKHIVFCNPACTGGQIVN